MTALTYLNRVAVAERNYQTAIRKLNREADLIEHFQTIWNGFSSPEYRNADWHGNYEMKYRESFDEIIRISEERNEIINDVEHMLAQLKTVNGDKVIYARFVEFKTMSAIADELHYSRQGIYKLLNRSMAELEQLLMKEKQDEPDTDHPVDDENRLLAEIIKRKSYEKRRAV